MAEEKKNSSIRTGAQKVAEIQSLFSLLSVRLQPMREAMLRNYNYVVGDQISPDVKKELARLRRPEIVMNYMHSIILSVAGYLYSERKAMRAIPIRMGDEKGAEMHTVLVSDFGVGDDGYFQIAKATVDATIAKYGVLNAYWTTRGDPEGRTIVESVDPFSILFDADARKTPDGGPDSDWRYYQYTRWCDCEELIASLPKLSEEKKAALREKAAQLEAAAGVKNNGKPVGWFSKIVNGMTQIWRNTVYDSVTVTQPLTNDWTDAKNGTYRVVEHHDRRMYVKKVIYDAVTRKSIPVPEEKYEDAEFLKNEMMKYGAPQIYDVPVEERWITVICPALMPDDVLVEMPYEVQDAGWQHKLVVCYDWHPDLTKMQSVADALISPQDAINQREMSWLEFVLDLLNPQVYVRKGAIDSTNMQAWLDNLRGALLEYNSSGPEGAPVKQYPNASIGQMLSQNKEENKENVHRISGVSPNLGGMEQTENESGILFNSRVQASLFNLATITVHQSNTMRHLFRYVDKLLQKNLTLPRTIRLLSEPTPGIEGVEVTQSGNENYYWLLLNWPTLQGVINDVKQGVYDFKVDMTQLGPTAKMAKFREQGEVIKILPEQMRPYHLWLKGWDNPNAKEWAQFVEERMGTMQMVNNAERALEIEREKQNLTLGAAERMKGLLEERGAGKGN
jgi:hypothetical protein